MQVGDLLEWLAAVAFTAAAYVFAGLELALAVAGVCLVYLAQGYASTPVKVKVPKPRRKK